VIFRILFSEDSSPESLEASPDIRKDSHPIMGTDNPHTVEETEFDITIHGLPDPLPAKKTWRRVAARGAQVLFGEA